MQNKVLTFTRKENFTLFLRFISVFTLIFLAMTVIIINVMNASIYKTTDEQLSKLKNSPQMLLNFAVNDRHRPQYEISVQDNNRANSDFKFAYTVEGGMNLNSFLEVLVYNEQGEVINTVGGFTNFDGIDPTLMPLDKIDSKDLENVFGELENYRMVCIDVTGYSLVDREVQSGRLIESQPAKYAVALVNTSQLQAASRWNNQIITVVMIIFWLLSVGVSVYLARLSAKPIIASYEKQKTFVENASHELRTPLSVLQNRLENLFRKPDATILESSESIASSLEEVRNMRILTQNLLDLARRDDGLEVKINELSPQFFDGVFQNFAMLAEQYGKKLVVYHQVDQVIYSDEALVKQVMTILFDNAIKYTGQDGHITMTTRLTDKQVWISVADNGPGISDSEKEKIFDRFYRVDKARSRQQAGFGLGLALAKQIVDKLKGSISVRDNSPQGTIFEVKLPRQSKLS